MKQSLIASVLLAGFFLGGMVFAQDEQSDVDQIITMCEDQYSADTYPDENERNRLIDECIENKLNSDKSAE